MTRVLVWHWGRRGAGPRYAAELAAGFGALAGTEARLSLSAQAELLAGAAPPACALEFPTYDGLAGAFARLPGLWRAIAPLARWIAAERIELALCAMPAALDPVMVAALRRAGVPYVAILHDADTHPGERLPLQAALRRHLARHAAAVVALSAHVGQRLVALGLAEPARLIVSRHPPFSYGPAPPPPFAHGGTARVLSFGRLLPYKGLGLLAAAMEILGPEPGFTLRVVGSGPESAALDRLRAAGAVVENRWVPEEAVGTLLAEADIVVLSHTEASQSGVVAAARAAGRHIVATAVGGITEQLSGVAGAVLCAPEPAALARALAGLVAAPPPPPAPADPQAEWREVAAALVGDLERVGSWPGAGKPAR